MCRMQPTTNEESSNTGIGSRTQPTKEQEEYARGFSAALHRLYAQRGTPAAVLVRLQSTSSDLDPTVPSKSTPPLSAACSTGQSSSSGVLSFVAGVSISTQSLPAVVRNMMTSADSQSASTKIPLCVTNLESNVSDDRLLDDQPQNQQPTCDRNSTGMNTRSSATAEKQRVSWPHGGGYRPSSPLPPPPLATPMHMVESETRNKLTSSVPSTKRTLR